MTQCDFAMSFSIERKLKHKELELQCDLRLDYLIPRKIYHALDMTMTHIHIYNQVACEKK